MKCRYITYKGDYFFYPECMGGAVYGLEGCTCSSNENEIEVLKKKIESLSKRIKVLEQKK